jgi:hypothetical protein
VGHLFTNSPLVWQPSHTITINENNQDVEFGGSNVVRIVDGEIFENDRVFSDRPASAAGGFQRPEYRVRSQALWRTGSEY